MPEPTPPAETTNTVLTTTGTTPVLTTTTQAASTGTPGYTPPATQEELDKIISSRLAREQAKFADYGDLKAKAEAHDAALEAAKTDAQRAVDAARSEGETKALERVNAQLVRAEARAVAAESKFRNPQLAAGAIDLTGITVDADGKVDAETIRTRLTALAAADPYLVDDGKPNSPRPDRSQGGGTTTPTTTVAAGRDLYAERHPARKTA